VIRRIILNQEGLTRIELGCDMFQIAQVRVGIEHFVAVVIVAGAANLYGAEDLDALALPSNRDLGLVPLTRPRLV